jgi:hypothetical protein
LNESSGEDLCTLAVLHLTFLHQIVGIELVLVSTCFERQLLVVFFDVNLINVGAIEIDID